MTARPQPPLQFHPNMMQKSTPQQPMPLVGNADAVFLGILGAVAIGTLLVSWATGVELLARAIMYAIWGITTGWVAFDSHRLYTSTSAKLLTKLSSGALAWFLGCFLLWIIVFPLYLFKRAKTLRERNASSGAVSLAGSVLIVIVIFTIGTAAPMFGAERLSADQPGDQAALNTSGVASQVVERLSVDQLRDQVCSHIKETLKEDPATRNVRVKNLTLIHRHGNDYSGILVADSEIGEETLSVDVTYDGNNFMWAFQ